ncbi:hypothetical protein HBA93_23975, partial [Ochrobactrum sp. SFR4]|nr:hypothetical protein [Ochrobactrum sp. SFR4]
PVADDELRGAGLTGDYGADVVLRDSPVQLTERLVLRLPHEEDIDALAVLADNVNVARMLARLPYPYSRDHAVDFIK